MDLTDILRSAGRAESFAETSNYYYENHICKKSGHNIKVRLDYTLLYDVTEEIIRFGVCEDCNTCFYHRDFRSSGL